MYRILLLIISLSSFVLARYDAYPTKECPAFNNMKHTKNAHNVHLDRSKKYTILQHHKGQHLILIKGEQPAQRWVDTDCFSQENRSVNSMNVSSDKSSNIGVNERSIKPSKVSFKKEYTKKYKNINTNKYENSNFSRQNILSLSWHNAFCETHRYKKECKRSIFSFGRPNYGEKHFVLHGLWPQPKNRLYCGVDKNIINMDKHQQWNRLPDLELSNELKTRLQKIMPGYASGLHKHEWIKHGTCYSKDANRYYEDAISLVEQMNHSKVGDFFRKQIGKHVTLQQVRAVFDRSFGTGSGKRVALKCHKGLITDLFLHLGSGSDNLTLLLKTGKKTRSQCQGGFIDKAGF